MKILIATNETQGQRDNDFNWCDENEIVTFGGSECDGEAIDGNCGCKRDMCGVVTRKGTTTMKIVERDISRIDLFKILLESISRAFPMPEEDLVSHASQDLHYLTQLCDRFPVGSVIEKRGNEFFVRKK